MGGIRKPKKKYVAPGHPWQKTRLAEELIYVGEYGLRNKRELWKHRTQLTQFRGTARDLVALPIEERALREGQLLGRLNRLALIDENSQLDDILNGPVNIDSSGDGNCLIDIDKIQNFIEDNDNKSNKLYPFLVNLCNKTNNNTKIKNRSNIMIKGVGTKKIIKFKRIIMKVNSIKFGY